MSSAAAPFATPRRDEHKAQVRRALVDGALILFATHGFDDVSTDDIAAAAGVSPRTYFRYFPTKESVLLFGGDVFFTAFTEVYLGQPATLREIDAISASFVALVPTMTALRRRIRLYHKAILSSAALRGQEQINHEANIARVAEAVASRRGLSHPDSACRLLATVSVMTLAAATFEWADGPARADLAEAIQERFALLVAVVTD